MMEHRIERRPAESRMAAKSPVINDKARYYHRAFYFREGSKTCACERALKAA